jgi:hypothetical protein
LKSRQANRGGNCSRQSQRKNRGRVSVPYEICRLREKERVLYTVQCRSARQKSATDENRKKKTGTVWREVKTEIVYIQIESVRSVNT